MSDLAQLKAEAKQLGVTWKEVTHVKRECEELMLASREAEEGARRRAWELMLHHAGRSVAGCRAFWRVGWDRVRCQLENDGRDFTAIPGYDLIFTAVAEDYPEWAARDAGELFEFLFGAYEPRPTAVDLYSEALGRIEASFANVPF